MKELKKEEERLGFFSGMLLGIFIPLMLFGGELKAKEKPAEAFYAGVIAGLLFDIIVTVSLIFLFKR